MTTTEPLMIRNEQGGPTVFTSGTQHVEWKGKGDPDGGDVQPCPPEFMQDVQFRRALTRSIFTVVEDAEDALSLHRDEWDARQTRQREASKDSLDTVTDNDLLMLKCLGPADRTGNTDAICGTEVPVKSSQVREKPPLCNKHKALVNQFLAEETDVIKGGKPEIRWVRPSVGARARQQD